MIVESIDHLVLTVRDIESTVAFYCKHLGMKKVEFSGDRIALSFGNQKINLHQHGSEFEPKASHPCPGSADLCFVTGHPVGELAEILESAGVEIIEGPVDRTGASGPILSIYFRDPDGNLIEVSNYGKPS